MQKMAGLQRCTICGINVIPKENGQCPACQAQMAEPQISDEQSDLKGFAPPVQEKVSSGMNLRNRPFNRIPIERPGIQDIAACLILFLGFTTLIRLVFSSYSSSSNAIDLPPWCVGGICLMAILSGIGLFMSRNWGRILFLVISPMMTIAFAIVHREYWERDVPSVSITIYIYILFAFFLSRKRVLGAFGLSNSNWIARGGAIIALCAAVALVLRLSLDSFFTGSQGRSFFATGVALSQQVAYQVTIDHLLFHFLGALLAVSIPLGKTKNRTLSHGTAGLKTAPPVSGTPSVAEYRVFWGCFLAISTTSFYYLSLRYHGYESELLSPVRTTPVVFLASIFLASFFVEKVGHKRSAAIASSCQIGGLVLLWIFNWKWACLVGGIIALFGCGIIVALMNAIISSHFPRDKAKWLCKLCAGLPIGYVLLNFIRHIKSDIGLLMESTPENVLLVILILTYFLVLLGRGSPLSKSKRMDISIRTIVKDVGIIGFAVPIVLILFFSVPSGSAVLPRVCIGLVLVALISVLTRSRTLGSPVFIAGIVALAMYSLLGGAMAALKPPVIPEGLKKMMESIIEDKGEDFFWNYFKWHPWAYGIYKDSSWYSFFNVVGACLLFLCPLAVHRPNSYKRLLPLATLFACIGLLGLFHVDELNTLLHPILKYIPFGFALGGPKWIIVFLTSIAIVSGYFLFFPAALGLVAVHCRRGTALAMGIVSILGIHNKVYFGFSKDTGLYVGIASCLVLLVSVAFLYFRCSVQNNHLSGCEIKT